MAKKTTYTDTLIKLINHSTLISDKLEVIDELGRRESSQLDFLISSSGFTSSSIDLSSLIDQQSLSEEITLFHDISVNKKPLAMEIDLVGVVLINYSTDGNHYKFTLCGIVTQVRNGFITKQSVENHFYSSGDNRFMSLIPREKHFYGNTVKREFALKPVITIK